MNLDRYWHGKRDGPNRCIGTSIQAEYAVMLEIRQANTTDRNNSHALSSGVSPDLFMPDENNTAHFALAQHHIPVFESRPTEPVVLNLNST